MNKKIICIAVVMFLLFLLIPIESTLGKSGGYCQNKNLHILDNTK